MKLLTTLIATLLAVSLNAGSNENLTPNKVHDSKPDYKEPGDKETGKPDKDHDRDKDDHHDPDDCDDDRHDHGKPKPPKPPKPPKDDATIPTAPTQLIAEAVSEFQVNLTWMDNSTNELGFKIERSKNGRKFKQVTQIPANTTSYQDPGLSPQARYCYRVRAYNSAGDSDFSDRACVLTGETPCALVVNGWGFAFPTFTPPGLTGVVAIAAGRAHALALKKDGTVVGWGGDFPEVITPPTNLNQVIAIAAGNFHSLALKHDGTVVRWGYEFTSEFEGVDAPENLTGIRAIAAGNDHSLALKTDGTVIGWGNNYNGQAIPPATLSGVMAIAAGGHSLALKTNGTVVGWGNDFWTGDATPPAGLTGVIAIAAGDYHSLALKANGTVVGWGGASVFPGGNAATPPAGLSNVVAISARGNSSLALKNDGTIVAWGGAFGPFSPPNLRGVIAISAGNSFSLALSTTPNSVREVVAQVIATNRIVLSWEDDSAGEVAFLIERAPSAGDQPGTWVRIGDVIPGTTSFPDTNVVANAAYWYRVFAYNACQVSLESYWSPPVTVSAPTNQPGINAYAFADRAHLYWYAGSRGVTGVKIERSADVAGSPGAWTEIINTNATDIFNNFFTDVGPLQPIIYWYRVRVVNGLGESPYSDPVSVAILPPQAPGNLSGYIGSSNQVSVSWSSAAPNDQDGYKVERLLGATNGPGTWTEIATVTNYYGYYLDSDVLPNLTYSYRVRAFNALGFSPYSPAISVNVVPPEAPLLWGNPFANSAKLNWNINYPGAIEHFVLERAPDSTGAPGTWTQVATITNFYFSAYTDPGLSPDTTYWYRLKAVNWVGASPFSTPVIVSIVPPAAPSYLNATIGSTNSINLSWQATSPYDQDGYKIERAVETGGDLGAWEEIGTVADTAHAFSVSYRDTNAAANTTYSYRVRSFNLAGVSSNSAPVSVSTVPPAAPSLWANPFANRVDLYWSGDYYTYGVVDGFKIERAPDVSNSPGTWTQIATAPGNDASGFSDSNRVANATYWYRVQAFNWIGASPYSSAVKATIIPPSPPQIVIGKIQTNGVSLRWLPGAPGDQDGFVLEKANDFGGSPGAWTLLATNAGFINQSGPYLEIGYRFTDTNVTANTTNWYRVRAYNVVGVSPFSVPISVQIVPPPAPGYFSVNSFATRADVIWNASFYGYGDVDGYKVERALDAGGVPGPWAQIVTLSNEYSLSFTDTGLMGDTTYWYRVQAYNWIGDGAHTAPLKVTIVPPQPPYGLSAEIGDTNKVNLRWSASPPDQDGFRLERASDVDGGPGAWEEIAMVGATNISFASFTDTNAMAYTTNWYRVRAFNLAGVSTYGPTTSVRIMPPNAPAYLTAARFANRVQLSWQNFYQAAPEAKVGIKIERANDSGGSPGAWELIAVTNFPPNTWVQSYVDYERTANLTYWYRVQAFNWVGDSPFSDSVSVTIIPPLPPYAPVATVGNTNQVILALFTPEPHDEDGFLIERATDANGLPGAWTQITAVAVTNLDDFNRFADTNVTANTTNWYRVRSYGVVGISSYSDATSVRLVPPPAPTDLSANPFRSQVELWWAANNGSYGLVQGFQLDRADDLGGVPGPWAQIAIVPNLNIYSAGYYGDTGRAADTTYWYRVRSFNWLGEGEYSTSVSATIRPPNPPRNLSATLVTSNSVELFWYTATPADQDGFRVERAAEVGDHPGPWLEIGVVSATNFWYGSYRDPNILPYTTNWYRVRAFNSVGVSAYSSTARLAFVPPPPPDRPVATQFANRISLNWSVPSQMALGYKIERANDLGADPVIWVQIAAVTGTYQTSFTDLGLAANRTYGYRVRSYNSAGDSAPSDPVYATILPPTVVTYMTATIGTTNCVNLQWSAVYPYDQDGFLLERASDSGDVPGTWDEIAAITNGYAGYTDSNVTANTTNWYRVRAFNAVGVSAYSSSARISVIPPPAPIAFAATTFSDQVNLSWHRNAYNYGLVQGYKIERATDVAGTPGVWTQIAMAADDYCGSYLDAGLERNTTYWYRVRAFNWIGDGDYATPVNVTIVPPAAPHGLTGIIGTTNQVRLLWYATTPQDQHGFRLESAPDAGGIAGSWTEIAIISATNAYLARFTDINVTAHTTNWYRVRAFNAIGLSGYSPALALRIAPPPAYVYLSGRSFANRIDLYWNASPDSYGLVDGYRIERAPDAGGSPGTWMQITAVTNNISYGYYTDPNLVAHATYWYRMSGYNWVGTGPSTLPISITINPPMAPYALSGSVGPTNQVYLSWSHLWADQEGLTIERASETNGLPGSWSVIATLVVTNTYSGSYFDTNVTANTTNWYRVRAFNLVGNSPFSAPARLSIIPPPAPQSLSASVSGARIYLWWYVNYQGQIGGYVLERARDAGGNPGTWVEIADLPNNYFEDTTLNANGTYWYRVRAYSWVGAAPDGGLISATITSLANQITAPPQITSLVLTNDDVRLTWTATTGSMNVVETATGLGGPFATLSPPINVTGSGTNYLDVGALTNSPARFYRIRVVP